MPLDSSTLVTAHFTARELGADKPEATASIIANLRRTADTLERVRVILGNVPLVMGTRSGFRTFAENDAVHGSPTSSHLTGEAGDFTPKGVTLYRAYNLLKEALESGQLPEVDQIIYYAYDGHIHVGIGAQRRQQILIQLTEGGKYLLASDDLVKRLPGYAVTAVAVVASSVSALGGWLPVLTALFFLFILARK